MIALLIAIFSGFIACFFAEQALLTIANYRMHGHNREAVQAAIGQWLVQILWIAIAVIGLFVVNEHVLLVKQHINSVQGLDRGFSMLAALILGFSAYRTLRVKKLEVKTVDLKNPFKKSVKIAFSQPIRILIYGSFFTIFGIHFVLQPAVHLIFLLLGSVFGSFLAWGIFCYSPFVATWREKEIKGMLDWTAYLVLIIILLGLAIGFFYTSSL